MAAISAQDEFTRWAKLRRQHDKALAEHDQKGEPQQEGIVLSKKSLPVGKTDTGLMPASLISFLLAILLRHQSQRHALGHYERATPLPTVLALENAYLYLSPRLGPVVCGVDTGVP